MKTALITLLLALTLTGCGDSTNPKSYKSNNPIAIITQPGLEPIEVCAYDVGRTYARANLKDGRAVFILGTFRITEIREEEKK